MERRRNGGSAGGGGNEDLTSSIDAEEAARKAAEEAEAAKKKVLVTPIPVTPELELAKLLLHQAEVVFVGRTPLREPIDEARGDADMLFKRCARTAEIADISGHPGHARCLRLAVELCPVTEQNIELAKQLAINWCTSKCKELDIPAEANIAELTR